MPIYEYLCRDCGHRFEKLQRTMSGPTTEPCAACGKKQAVKVLSSFAVSAEGAGAKQPVPAGGGGGGVGGGCACGKPGGGCGMR
ncbi:MAG: zinc ribbon domain-containing protein [Phycisphaerae bacterium]